MQRKTAPTKLDSVESALRRSETNSTHCSCREYTYSHSATLPAWLSCLRRTRRANHRTVCHRKSHTRRQRMAVLILRPIPMETASTLFTRTSDDLPVGRSLRSIYTTATLPPQHYSSTSVLRTLNLRIDRSAIRSHWCAVQLRCNSKCTEARHSHPLLRVSEPQH